MFKNTPTKRINKLIASAHVFEQMYYGVLYLQPITTCYGTITEYTKCIRECIIAIDNNTALPPYQLRTYYTMYDWLDTSNPSDSIRLWLKSLLMLLDCFDRSSAHTLTRGRLASELPTEYLMIITRLEQICEESKRSHIP